MPRSAFVGFRLGAIAPRTGFSRPGHCFTARLPRTAGGFAFACDLGDEIAREACFTGQYEPLETAIVHAALRDGATFVDVGAHWGYFSLLAAHLVGGSGRVVALEPDPRLHDALAANVTRNNLPQVTAVAVAASESAGTAVLQGFAPSATNRGVSSLMGSDGGEGPSYSVRTEAMDDLLDALQVGVVDLIKVDVEGAEALVLRGMRRGLAAHRYRRLLLELHPAALTRGGFSIEAITQSLTGAGYEGWWINHDPAAQRRAAYARRVDFASYLRPWREAPNADAWPHMIWLAPGTAVLG